MSCPIGNDVSLAARLLREGRLVAFGTETVYGLGANALDAAAVARVFEAKRRPTFDPLIVHISNRDALGDIVERMPPAALQLADAFWPGPLTLVLPKREVIPDLVTSGRPTVGVRIPASEMTRRLLSEAGVPIAAPSANTFGRISPTTAAHVAEQLGDAIDYILDCGPCGVGIESAVVDLTEDVPLLLRPGGTTLEDLESVAGRVNVVTSSDGGSQRAPGMLSRHYSPRTPLVVADQQDLDNVTGQIGLLSFHDPVNRDRFARIEVLSKRGDLVEAAANFFAALRRLDDAGLDHIVATPFPMTGLGRALNDRLRRAAARE
ncbi:MAG: threonylcarbamoyl-AMP synthase [Planctomycetaceae bacterium]|nr:threonylcarbamoyl-AMP synthase [Planctomycetaceae bacterium]